MEELPSSPLEPQPEAPQKPAMSLAARLLNVFAVPGDVFEDVKRARASTANWLVPVLLFAVVGALSAFIMFSQPAIQQQVREQQAKAVEQQVKAGKLTREQADQALAVAEKFTGPTMMKIFGTAGAVAAGFVRVLWWGFILWLLSRWLLKAPLAYGKTLEVAGLATMISVLGAIVTLLLTVNLGRMFATPSLALVVSDFDVARKSHLLLGAANVFSFWFIGLLSAGLARLAGVAFFRAAAAVFAFFVLQELAFIASGCGSMAL